MKIDKLRVMNKTTYFEKSLALLNTKHFVKLNKDKKEKAKEKCNEC